MVSLLVKLLGLVDLTAALLLLTANLHLAPQKIVLFVALFLGMKGLLFLSDPVSKFDVLIAGYLCLTLLWNITFLSVILGVYLILKGLYSLV